MCTYTICDCDGDTHKSRQSPNMLDIDSVTRSGLDESSGRISTIVLHGIALRIYLMFSQTGKNTTH